MDDCLDDNSDDNSIGDIDLSSSELNPGDRAKSVKKRAIMLTAGGIGAFAVTAVASNMLFTSPPEQQQPQDQSLVSSASTSPVGNSVNALPDKYTGMGKYASDKQRKGTDQINDQNYPANNNTNSVSKPYSSSASQPQYSTYSSSPSPVTITPIPSTSYETSSRSSNNYDGDSNSYNKVSPAERDQQTAINSALAFKIAADIVQGKTPEGATQPVSATQQASYTSSSYNTGNNFSLMAGAVIPATLLTGITTDIPNADVVAQVRQNIYDSTTGTHLLIPQGSRLIGVYGAATGNGDPRIGVVFKRILLPNGLCLNMPDQKAIDGAGYPGLSDIYDDHRGSAYRAGFITALFGALAQSATGGSSGTETRSPGQEAVSGAVASILQTGQKFIDRDLQVNSTIQIRPGFQFSVFINQDMLLREYDL